MTTYGNDAMFTYSHRGHIAQVEVIAGRVHVTPSAVTNESILGLRLRVRLAWDRVRDDYLPSDVFAEQALARELGATPPPVQHDENDADRVY